MSYLQSGCSVTRNELKEGHEGGHEEGRGSRRNFQRAIWVLEQRHFRMQYRRRRRHHPRRKLQE